MQSADPVATAGCSVRTRRAVEQLFQEGNRDALVGELCAYVSHAEAEDLVQRSVERALSGRCRAEHVAGVHLWIRQDARFALSHLLEWQRMSERKLALEGTTMARPDELPSPDDDLAQETSIDLAHQLVADAKLSQVDQELVRLYWGERLPRKQVAGELGLAEGTVKKRLARAGTVFEGVLVQRCGGGCGGPEEAHVRAYAFQHRTARGNIQALALAHMDACQDCNRLFTQLEQVRLAVAAMAPLPLAASGSGRQAMHAFSDRLPSWEQISHGARAVRDRVLDAKSHIFYSVSRVDPTPLAGFRPGAGAAVLLTSCLATVGGGVYCVKQGLDPAAGIVRTVHQAEKHHKHVVGRAAISGGTPAPGRLPSLSITAGMRRPRAAARHPKASTKRKAVVRRVHHRRHKAASIAQGEFQLASAAIRTRRTARATAASTSSTSTPSSPTRPATSSSGSTSSYRRTYSTAGTDGSGNLPYSASSSQPAAATPSGSGEFGGP